MAEKQRRYTTRNNGANIRRKVVLVTCTLDAVETNVVPMRDNPYTAATEGEGGGVFVSCVFIARPGNNNWLLFITPPRVVFGTHECRSHLHVRANHSFLLRSLFFVCDSSRAVEDTIREISRCDYSSGAAGKRATRCKLRKRASYQKIHWNLHPLRHHYRADRRFISFTKTRASLNKKVSCITKNKKAPAFV